MKKQKNVIIQIIVNASQVIFSLLFITSSLFYSPFVYDQSISNLLSQTQNNVYIAYETSSAHSTLISFSYKNFSSDNNYTTAYFENSLPVQTNLFLSGDSYGSLSLINLASYDNQVTLKRFETININLYKTPTVEQNESYSCDGTVYIPDYLADQIIQNNEDLQGYDDLLPDLSVLDEATRNSFLSSCSVSIDVGSTTRSYRISNIFHVDGFNEEYCSEIYEYNDNGVSQTLSSFYGNYVVINDSELSNIYEQRMVVGCVNKQYVIYDEIKEAMKAGGSSPTIYDIDDNGVSINQEYTELLNKSFSYSGLELYQTLLLVLGIALLGIHIFLNVYFRKRIDPKTFLFSAIGITTIMLIMQIIYVVWGQYNLTFLTIYNAPFNIVMVICLVLYISLFLITRRKKNG